MGFSATHRRTRRSLACVPILCILVAAPTAALARAPRSGGSGGAGLGSGGGSTSSGSSTNAATTISGVIRPAAADVVRLTGVVNTSGDGITLTVAASGTQGRPLTITGAAPAGDAGETIDVESARPGSVDWSQVATAVIEPSGVFSARWTPAASAQVDLRAVLAPGLPATGSGGSSGGSSSGGSGLPGTGSASTSASTAASQLVTAPLTIPIFRNAVATMYGPGFWGHHTACGERLTRATLGVASRTLRCGTRVAVFYRGRELTVPVIDRGPYANGATWDLTMATARALGIRETVMVGTLAPAPPAAAAVRAQPFAARAQPFAA